MATIKPKKIPLTVPSKIWPWTYKAVPKPKKPTSKRFT